MWPRWATPTTVTTVQAAHAATARYVAGGPTMSRVGCGVSVMKDHGPRCAGSGPMMVCTAPPPIGLAIMLLWSGSLTIPPGISAALMGDAPGWHDRDRIRKTIGECNSILLREICTRKGF